MTRHLNALKLTGLSVCAIIAGQGLAGTADAHAGKEKVLFSFDGTDGYGPQGALIADAKGNLYGTTSYQGGAYGWGVVFELSPAKHGWKETVLYNFTGGADGGGPLDSLVFDSQGNLYGTTVTGGEGKCIKDGTNYYGCGVVFELARSGKTWKETVLHTFVQGQSAGVVPEAGLVFDSAGNLYGTTSSPNGTVFEMSPTSNGWQYQDILVFHGGSDGALPQANLIFDSAGNIYGTTVLGGTTSDCIQNTGCGVVFELTPSNGTWTETVLHAFTGGTDGAYPTAALMFDKNGNLYGTTTQGGTNGCLNNLGCGTVFELTPGSNGWTENVLYNFPCGAANCTIGATPSAAVIMDASGNLYSTTAAGGTGVQGVIFELKPGKSSWTEKVLHTFMSGGDGQVASAPLLAMPNGHMYGVTVFGGTTGNGTVFEINP